MNNLSDFANFGELQIVLGESGGGGGGAPGEGRRGGAPEGGGQTGVCAPGAKNPRYASDSTLKCISYPPFTWDIWPNPSSEINPKSDGQ